MLKFLIIFSFFFLFGNCLKILGLFFHPVKSHFDVYEPLLKALASRGHEVTVISHFPQKKTVPGYRDISVRQNILVDVINIQELPTGNNFYHGEKLGYDMAKENCRLLEAENVKNLIGSNETFDLIISEVFITDCFLSIVHRYKVPFIGVGTHPPIPLTSSRFGSPANPSYVPTFLSSFSDKMDFLQRFQNTLFYLYNLVYHGVIGSPHGEREARKLFGSDLPPLDNIARNMSLLLSNTHFTLNRPRPLVPNIIEVNGIHIGKTKKLPKVRVSNY